MGSAISIVPPERGPPPLAAPAIVYFEERLLRSAEDLRQSFRLRYEVYCDEMGFLPADDYPDGVEIDAFDARSLHFGSFNTDGAIVGTVRLVCGGGIHDLPMDSHCPLYPQEQIRLAVLPGLAEISRLAVSCRYRRRAEDGQYGLSPTPSISSPEKTSRPDRRRVTHPTVLRLYRAMYHALKQRGMAELVASMEMNLFRVLRSLRFPFHEIGPEAEYYGSVWPFSLNLDELDEALMRARPELYDYFNLGLDPALKRGSGAALPEPPAQALT